ncbi:serine hydrolase domain-containing protein [Cyclobacterium marinum]|uniref:Beta-lactamase n=1 Tax=Cyclobacterium marinum (strain ATCC 25205 / DSM 745 / LMG 13164 / NCIMB 1802) TaxID=880070 RepID=G0J5U7_CYCMS|nr:serine hydrolase domain-containing protein [Cyclobacterium marinum]AEL25398.1 beta-lactamase [Cyclobacterium marinum DSM 745]
MLKLKILFLIVLIGCGCEEKPVVVNFQQGYHGKISEGQSKLIHTEAKGFFNQTQLSIAIIKNGKPEFYGVKIENDTMFSVENQDSVFEIGSISKVFTATLLADLSLDGKLNLNDPAGKYLPWKLKNTPEFTLQQLSNHSSGLPRLPDNLILSEVDMSNPYKDYGEEKLGFYLTEQLELQQDPGLKFDYSNLGVGLLGYMLTRIDSSSYEEMIQNRIAIPFQMESTTVNREKVMPQLVKGLDVEGKETPNWDLNVLQGAGAILSSTQDLTKFALAQFNPANQTLALTQKKTFSVTAYEKAIGLGWMIENKKDGKWLWHGGGTGGYSSSFTLDLDRKNAVIILSNVSGFSENVVNISNLGSRLMEMIED